MDAAAVLASRVREVVRERRIDPRRDVDEVRRIATEAVGEWDRRSLSGAIASLDDPDQVVAQIMADVSGFGPLQALLDDPAIEEIWINSPDRVFVARGGTHELTTVMLSAEQVRELIERMLSTSGRRLDLSQPFVDAMLPGGHRLHVVLDGITRGFSAVNIRKFVARAQNLTDLVTLGTLTRQAADFLDASIRAGLNVVVAGGTQAGKTTLLNCLAGSIPGKQRVISAEEVFELQFTHPDWVAMQTRQAGLEGTGEIDLRTLVKEALRMRPSRIVIGEVRGAEALDLLLAFNAGLPGMATIHANSARQALTKMCTLPLLAGENISSAFVVPTVANAVDLVVHTRLQPDGHRRVHEIVCVSGRVEADTIETATIFETRGDQLVRGRAMPSQLDTYALHGIDIAAILTHDHEEPAWAP